MSECNDRIRAYNELCRSVLSIWYSPILETSPFSSEYFTEILRSYIFGPGVVKYGILSNNRRSKLHAVIDCLFFSLVVFHCWRRCCFRNCNRSCQRRVSERKALLRLSFFIVDDGSWLFQLRTFFSLSVLQRNWERRGNKERIFVQGHSSIHSMLGSFFAGSFFFASLSMPLYAWIDQLVISTILVSPLCTAKGRYLTLFGESWLEVLAHRRCYVWTCETKNKENEREKFQENVEQ